MNRNDHHDSGNDIDRRGFLSCMAWAGTGVLWSVRGGLLASRAFGQGQTDLRDDFSFAQISDSHIGFSKPPNADVTGTLKVAVRKINALPQAPAFVLHT